MSEAAGGADPSLGQCLAVVRALLPALAGRIAAPGQPGPDVTSRLIDDLLSHGRAAHPAAGRAYWASRSWGLLIWQPAYLCVLSVHLNGALPALDGLCQDCERGEVAGFSLPAHSPRQGEISALIVDAGAMLARLWPHWHGALCVRQAYSRQLAACLLADCLLSALLLLPAQSRQQLEAWARQWLSACGLEGKSGLAWATLADGAIAVGLERRGCCQHYRLDQACASCPRRAPAERLRLLRQQPSRVLTPEPLNA